MTERIVKINELGEEVEYGQYIVRCKNCKYSRHSILPQRNIYYCNKHAHINHPDSFCSDGEEEE